MSAKGECRTPGKFKIKNGRPEFGFRYFQQAC